MPPASPDPGALRDHVEPDGLPEAVAWFTGRALGSSIRLGVRCGADGADGEAAAAWAEVVDELAEVDAALSRFRDDAEVTALNRLAGAGGTALVSRRLRIALATCHRAACLTDGRFDAGMVDVLERIGEHGASLSSPEAPAAAPIGREEGLRPVGIPIVPVDLGGIGKGLALRWAAERAMRRLPPGAGVLLDAGGDLIAGGTPPAAGWLVGVEDPAAPDPASAEPLAVIALEAGAVATSSVQERRWTAPDGRAVHHLLDPRTREPAHTGLIAVTVALPDPAWAEVWTKALFLAGSRGIGEEARSRGLAAWWVDHRGRLGMTPEARVRTTWAAESRIG